MVQNPCAAYDDPHNYFQRLQSYSSTKPSFSRPTSNADNTSQASPIRSLLGPRPQPGTTDRPAHSRHDSASTLQNHEYADSDHLAPDIEKASARRSNRLPKQYTASTRPGCTCSRRCKLIACIVAFVVGLIVIIAVAVHLKDAGHRSTISTAHVTNQEAFATGGATHRNVNHTTFGNASAVDRYVYYTGNWQKFPDSSKWISFATMWKANLPTIQNSCAVLGYSSSDSESDIRDIYNAIQDRANASLVDHRYILAVVLQESHGCVHVVSTTSSGGVNNPGLMQSHDGTSYSSSHPSQSILTMIQDGTQGTSAGGGLVQNLNIYGNPYSAARGYNSGHVPRDGNLSKAAGATACYVSDIANRLTGWVNAMSTCPGDKEG